MFNLLDEAVQAKDCELEAFTDFIRCNLPLFPSRLSEEAHACVEKDETLEVHE